MIVLGTCANCTACGDLPCDEIVILIGNGLEPANPLSFLFFGEGNTPTITVSRLANHEVGYHGDPAYYETIEGVPPPVSEGGFFLDWDTGNYWQNNGGVFTIETPDYGNGEVQVRYTVTLTDCGCDNMWTAESRTVTWADGETGNKSFTLTPPSHVGVVPFWSCPGSPFFGENATLNAQILNVGTGGCADLGYDVTLTGVCGHTVTNSGWGSATPYQVRIWSAVDAPTVGRNDYNGDSAPTYLREDASFDYDDAGTADGSGWKELFPHGNLGDKEVHYTSDTVNDSVLFRAANTGATSATERTFHDFGGQLTSELSVPGTDYPVPIAGALALLAEAKAADIEGGEGYAWSAPVQEFVFKIRANNANYDFSDPGFNPSKTYAYTGSTLPAEPFDPGDWTEVADTGFAFEYVATTAQTKGFNNASTGSLLGLSCLVGGDGGWAARSSTIDASRSASGSPYPYTVEIRISEYHDFGTLISTGGWIDITDTVYELDAPTSLGGATLRRYYLAEYQLTPLTTGCATTGSPTFICHPGLSC